MSEAESAAYKPVVAHDKEENYKQFEAVHGFDIRTLSGDTLVSRTDARDMRDPEALGRALTSRPASMTILEMAALIEETR